MDPAKNKESKDPTFISKESIHRLLRDVKQIMVNPLTDNGIYYKHSEEDMLQGYAMIIGPKDTPYYGGYYFFDIRYPANYPQQPPVVRYFTNGDDIRFNPNLYKSGKVCVSILNTWRGDQWNSCQTISSMLLTLCTLLCKDPLLNEPGVTNKHNDFEKYNKIIEYKNIELAMLHMINKKTGYYLSWFDMFYVDMIKFFVENNNELMEYVKEMVQPYKSNTNTIVYKTSLYSMNVNPSYSLLEEYFQATRQNIKLIIKLEQETYKDIKFSRKKTKSNKTENKVVSVFTS